MTNALPEPSRRHATCAWCQASFATISELLDHVDSGHLDPPSDQRGPQAAPTLAVAA